MMSENEDWVTRIYHYIDLGLGEDERLLSHFMCTAHYIVSCFIFSYLALKDFFLSFSE